MIRGKLFLYVALILLNLTIGDAGAPAVPNFLQFLTVPFETQGLLLKWPTFQIPNVTAKAVNGRPESYHQTGRVAPKDTAKSTYRPKHTAVI